MLSWCAFALTLVMTSFSVLQETRAGAEGAGAPATEGATAPASPRLADLGFLAGSWGGAMGDDHVEEHWSAPRDGSLIGMLRWHKPDGRPSMFELIAITEERVGDDAAPTVVMRLRHFSGDLVPIEGRDDPMTLHLTQADAAARSATFTAAPGEQRLTTVTYTCPDPDRLLIVVSFPEGERPRRPLRFDLSRMSGQLMDRP